MTTLTRAANMKAEQRQRRARMLSKKQYMENITKVVIVPYINTMCGMGLKEAIEERQWIWLIFLTAKISIRVIHRTPSRTFTTILNGVFRQLDDVCPMYPKW